MSKIIIPSYIQEEITAHLRNYLPQEGCGLLAGKGNRISLFIPVTNSSVSETTFIMEPVALYQALIRIESLELDLLTIVHSHPKGPLQPSITDIREFLYQGVVTMICVPDNDKWECQTFLIENNDYFDIELVIEN
jgi:proteasome lid subunit RPN8/RPN11